MFTYMMKLSTGILLLDISMLPSLADIKSGIASLIWSDISLTKCFKHSPEIHFLLSGLSLYTKLNDQGNQLAVVDTSYSRAKDMVAVLTGFR